MRSQVNARFCANGIYETTIEFVGSGIVKLRCNGPENGQGCVISIPQLVVSLVLFFYVAKGIECSAFVEFVDGHNICKIEHVDFFELRCSAKLRCHDIQCDIAVIHDLGITLTNARGLKYDQVETRCF